MSTADLPARILAEIDATEEAARQLPERDRTWTRPAGHYFVEARRGAPVLSIVMSKALDHIERNDPQTVLRRCAADREIVQLYTVCEDLLAVTEGTILRGAAKVRLGAYENVLHKLAEGYGITVDGEA